MNKYLAEFLGTMIFLYAILASGNPYAIGIALTIVILIFGPISGGHFNPAVSVMMVFDGALDSSDLLPYVAAQIGGGIVALQAFDMINSN